MLPELELPDGLPIYLWHVRKYKARAADGARLCHGQEVS
jgi:hypothetical protein